MWGILNLPANKACVLSLGMGRLPLSYGQSLPDTEQSDGNREPHQEQPPWLLGENIPSG